MPAASPRSNSFQTTVSPNPEKFYKYHSVTKQAEHMFLNVLSKCFQVPVPVVWKSFSGGAARRWSRARGETTAKRGGGYC